MSQATRFVTLALAGWIGVRAVSLGLIPGGEAITFDRRTPSSSAGAVVPPVTETHFAAVEPVTPTLAPYPPFYPPAYPAAYPVLYPVPAYATGMPPARVISAGRSPAALAGGWGPEEVAGYSLAPAAARYAAGVAPIEQWPLAAIASGTRALKAMPTQSVPVAAIRAIPSIDRLSMSAWAMMRRDPGAPSLAANGQLGGSQAGARFLWRFDRHFAASVRSSAPVGGTQRSAELAAGLRWQPYAQFPVALTAERRQAFGRDKGASGFAMFAEGGVYDRPIVARFALDAYLQAGVVGVRNRAAFVDGSANLTRPVWRGMSAGFGVWGGAQPSLARLDVGPRASLRLGRSMRVHLDYRHRLVGHAAPGSGPVVTLAGDF